MQRVYCWRCKKEVAAFDEPEYAELWRIVDETKERSHVDPRGSALEQIERMNAWYLRTTGQGEIDPQERGDILKHRLWMFGPPCRQCGKNLRTPQARKCFECGRNRES